jgi:hypothetical protein
MISPVFTAHLMTTGGGLSGEPLCEETTDDNLLDITEALQPFAHFLELDQLDESEDTNIDLSASYDNFIELYSIDEESAEYIAAVILESSQKMFGDSEDDTAIHFLRQLSKSLETERGEINKSGMTVPNTQIGSKAVLALHPVSRVKDAFGNLGFSSDRYQYFPRGENRFGKEAEFKDPNQAYNQIGGFPLMNPVLNVNTAGGAANLAKKLPSGRAFESVDAVGIGAITHYRVLNKLSGQFVTNQIHKEQADEIAAGLNHEYEQVLSEHPDLIKEFERATSKPSEIPATNLQEGLNNHSNIQRYASYLSKTAPRLDSGSRIATDTVASQAISDFKATQKLINENRRPDDQIDEMAALNARSTGRGRRR